MSKNIGNSGKRNPDSFSRRLGVAMLKGLFNMVYWPRISYESDSAREYIRSGEPFIIISNHTNWFDPVVMYSITKGHRLSVVAAKEVLEGFRGKPLRTLGCIPVDRTNMDLVCLRECAKRVREGEKVAIFPEGMINFSDNSLQEFKAGVSLISAQTGAKVVPVCISGDYRPFGHLRVLVGDSVDLKEQFSSAATAAEISKATDLLYEIMTQLQRKLLESLTPAQKAGMEKFRAKFISDRAEVLNETEKEKVRK